MFLKIIMSPECAIVIQIHDVFNLVLVTKYGSYFNFFCALFSGVSKQTVFGVSKEIALKGIFLF